MVENGLSCLQYYLLANWTLSLTLKKIPIRDKLRNVMWLPRANILVFIFFARTAVDVCLSSVDDKQTSKRRRFFLTKSF